MVTRTESPKALHPYGIPATPSPVRNPETVSNAGRLAKYERRKRTMKRTFNTAPAAVFPAAGLIPAPTAAAAAEPMKPAETAPAPVVVVTWTPEEQTERTAPAQPGPYAIPPEAAPQQYGTTPAAYRMKYERTSARAEMIESATAAALDPTKRDLLTGAVIACACNMYNRDWCIFNRYELAAIIDSAADVAATAFDDIIGGKNGRKQSGDWRYILYAREQQAREREEDLPPISYDIMRGMKRWIDEQKNHGVSFDAPTSEDNPAPRWTYLKQKGAMSTERAAILRFYLSELTAYVQRCTRCTLPPETVREYFRMVIEDGTPRYIAASALHITHRTKGRLDEYQNEYRKLCDLLRSK